VALAQASGNPPTAGVPARLLWPLFTLMPEGRSAVAGQFVQHFVTSAQAAWEATP